MKDRLEKVRDALGGLGLDAVVVTKIENVRYLSGFTGSNAVAIVTGERTTLVTDGRYREQAAREAASWETVIYEADIAEAVAAALSGHGSAGFESSITLDFHRRLKRALQGRVSLRTTRDLVEKLRSVKDGVEVALIREALDCVAEARRHVLPLVRPGATERELAAEIDYRMRLAGADGPAFDTVVASGPNSSLPHAGITDRTLEEGDLVVVDFGARRRGYCSDTTRTLVAGEPGTRETEVYATKGSGTFATLDAVRGALEAALESLRPGMRAAEADLAARGYLAKKGLAEGFCHGLGHGVGLEVHEKPALSSRSKDVLEPGMVFTVEPGVYIEGWGGARLEEMVLMTDSGPEMLWPQTG